MVDKSLSTALSIVGSNPSLTTLYLNYKIVVLGLLSCVFTKIVTDYFLVNWIVNLIVEW